MLSCILSTCFVKKYHFYFLFCGGLSKVLVDEQDVYMREGIVGVTMSLWALELCFCW